MTKYLCNSISAQMLLNMTRGRLSWVFIDESMFKFLIEDAVSVMGHQELADKLELPYNRKPIYLENGDVLYVAQVCNYRGMKSESEEDIKYLQIFVEE